MFNFQPKWNFSIWSSFAYPKLHSPRSTSCCCKRWQQGGFQVFLGLLIIQNLMKCFGNDWACITYHEKPKNINFSSSKCPNHKRARRHATRIAETSVLGPKNFNVSRPASEALAIIQNGSSVSRRFSVLLVYAVQWCNLCLGCMMCCCPPPWCCKICVGLNEMKNEDLVLLFQTPNVGGTVGNRVVWIVDYKRVGFVFFNIHTLTTDLQTTPNTDQR